MIFLLFLATIFCGVNSDKVNGHQSCGVSYQSANLETDRLKVGKGDWPWMVALIDVETRSFFCGGVLIAANKVLTAASCIHEKGFLTARLPQDILVKLGAYNLSDPFEPGAVFTTPAEIIIHHDWNASSEVYDANIAVIMLQHNLTYSKHVRPICLPSTELHVEKGFSVGWKQNDGGHEDIPTIVNMQIQEECSSESFVGGIDPTLIFCGISQNGGKLCQDGLGEGLFVKVREVFYIKGLLSTSLKKDRDCDSKRAALYTNIEKFINWIKITTSYSPSEPFRRLGQAKAAISATIYLPKGKTYSIGSDITIFCDVTGEPAPEIEWYKDNHRIDFSNKTFLYEPDRIIVSNAKPEDSGNYRCSAHNHYSHASAAEVITVEGPKISSTCIDKNDFANCALILKGNYCKNKYYAKFCCRSCTLAGKLEPRSK